MDCNPPEIIIKNRSTADLNVTVRLIITWSTRVEPDMASLPVATKLLEITIDEVPKPKPVPHPSKKELKQELSKAIEKKKEQGQ